MKKIFALTIAALLVLGVVGGGTWAYFQDTESSTNNSLTAGTLDLTIEGGNAAVTTFSASNVYPGQSGSGNSTLKNVGSLPGNLTIATANLINTESSGGTEFEGDGGSGELGGVAKMAIWIDVGSQNNTYDAGTDIGLKSDGTTYTSGALQYDTIDNYAGKTWTNVLTNVVQNQVNEFNVSWQVPYGSSVDNSYQGDAVSIDFQFTLVQYNS